MNFREFESFKILFFKFTSLQFRLNHPILLLKLRKMEWNKTAVTQVKYKIYNSYNKVNSSKIYYTTIPFCGQVLWENKKS